MEPVPVLHVLPELAGDATDRLLFDLLSRLDRDCFRIALVTTAAVPCAGARQRFRGAGIATDHLALDLPPAGGPWQRLVTRARALRQLRDYLRRARPRIVHTHGALLNAYGALAARLADVPHIMTHDHDLQPSGGAGIGLVDRWVWRWTALLPDVAFVSSLAVEAVRRSVLHAGSERVLHLPYGVDLQRFVPASPAGRRAARAALGLPDTAFAVGAGARLAEPERLDPIVLALPLLAREVPESVLVVLGDEPDLLRVRARDLGMADRLVLAGRSTGGIPAYHALDVFVTLGEGRGGSGSALPEALACGLPVVAAGASPHAALAGSGAAQLVESKPWAIARGLTGLARPGSERPRLADCARRHAVQHFDVERAARRLEAAYAHCVARTPRPWVPQELLPAP